MNDSIKSTIVLTCICLIVTLLLGVINFITAPIIAEANEAATLASFYEVLPEAESFEELELPSEAPETVQSIYMDTAGSGYAISLATSSQYSSSDMLITVGIGTDGIIKNIVLTSYTESKDFGADYPSTYIGQDSALSGVDTVSGVTYSSTAFKNAVADAYTALFAVSDVAAGEKTDAQIAAEAVVKLVPGSANNTGVCEMTFDEESGLFISSNRTAYAMVGEDEETGVKAVYISDAFGNYLGCVSSDSETAVTEDENIIVDLTGNALAECYVSMEKTAERVVKIYEDADFTAIYPVGVTSTVNCALKFTSGGNTYYAVTASPFGYGGEMDLLYIIDENDNIAKFKVISHNETEYYGAKVSENSYTSSYEGLAISAVGDDTVVISGCTYTTNAVRKALADVTSALPAIKEAE